MTTHLFGPPGTFPDALCGHASAWSDEPGVYFRDLDKVTCPECLGRVEIPTAEPYEDEPDVPITIRQKEVDLVYVVCWVLFCSFLFIIGLWWLT